MAIVDAYGRPASSKALREPQTARIAAFARRMPESQLRGLSPQSVARLLIDADTGDLSAQAELFDDMQDRDAHLACEIGKRCGAVAARPWSIQPPAGASAAEKKAASLVQELLQDAVDDLEDLVLALMDGAGHGFAAVEIEWRMDGKVWLPTFHPRPQSWLRYDTTAQALRLADGSPEGAELRPLGWVLHEHRKAKTGYLGRSGILRACVWPFLYKAYAIGDFAEFLQVYGLPMVLGKYMPGATEEEKSSLLKAVAAMSSDARAIMPEGMGLEVMKITASGTGANPHLEMTRWADDALSKAILGQVLSSEARPTGLGSGVAELHKSVRRDILLADCRQIAGTLDRDLVYPLTLLNAPGVDAWRRSPRWIFDVAEREDMGAYAEALPKLVQVGARIPVAWAHEKLGIPMPKDGEEVLTAPNPAPESMRAALSVAAPEPEHPAELAAAGQMRAAQAAVDAWLVRIRGVLDASDSLEDFRAKILAAYADLSSDDLAVALAAGNVVAQLAGRFDAVGESRG